MSRDPTISTTNYTESPQRRRVREPSPTESYLHMVDSATTLNAATDSTATIVPHRQHSRVPTPAVMPIPTNDVQTNGWDAAGHARDDSGTYSTLSSSALGSIGVPPMQTIGVARGAELVRTRPQILAPSPRQHQLDNLNPVRNAAANRSLPDFRSLECVQ